MTGDHLDTDQIERYSMGDVSREETERFEEHLLVCEVCRSRIEESDAYIAAVRRAAAEDPSVEASPEHPQTIRSNTANNG